MLEKIKELLGEELAGQVEAALKGKGKEIGRASCRERV